MNAIIQQFHMELTPEERRLLAHRARLAGRRPGVHLKALLFSRSPAPPLPRVAAPAKPSRSPAP